MDASATPPSAETDRPADRRVMAVAYSAGRDSTALLHACAQAGKALSIEVLALHVHHGLSLHADAWLQHGRAQCEQWAAQGLPVRFIAHHLNGQPAPGESTEAWARHARYLALAQMARAQGTDLILLAHHLSDQAETWMLQALRGGGLRGQAAMPERIERDGITWVRPWLDKPRRSIEQYIEAHALSHIEDDSNADPRFARNRLRLQVWPALTSAFPQAEASLAKAAQWAQESAACLDEVAQEDLTRMVVDDRLCVPVWRSLSPLRRGNALRALLKAWTGQAPSASLALRLQSELMEGPASARWAVGQGSLILHRQRLGWSGKDADLQESGDLAPGEPETALSISQVGDHPLPGWGGVLQVRQVSRGGLAIASLARLQLRARVGGESFQMAADRPARSLKKQYQAAALPAWERNGPLVYSEDCLVYVPGLGLDARATDAADGPQVSLHWKAVNS